MAILCNYDIFIQTLPDISCHYLVQAVRQPRRLVHVFFILAFCYSKKVSKGYFLYPCRERLTSTHFSNSPLKAQFNWNFYGHSFFILQVLTLGNVTMGACFKGGTWIGFNILDDVAHVSQAQDLNGRRTTIGTCDLYLMIFLNDFLWNLLMGYCFKL